MEWTVLFDFLYAALMIAAIIFLVVFTIYFYRVAKSAIELIDTTKDLVEDAQMKISTFDEVFETIRSIVGFTSDIGTKVTKYLKFKNFRKGKKCKEDE